MASALIHMAVAKKVNEELKMEEKSYLLGSIAPDIAKMVGSERYISHFCKETEDSPNISLFLSKYKDFLNNPFEMGYYVHLLTDVLWFDEFLPNFVLDNFIINKHGEKIYVPQNKILEIIYNDYSNLNEKIINYYDLDYSLFYEDFKYPESHIKELPNEYFDALIKKFSNLTTLESNYNYIIEIEPITHFIEYAVKYCLDNIRGNNE